MTPPKQPDGPSCPLPGCNMAGLADAIKANSDAMTTGFHGVNEMQAERLKQVNEIKWLLKLVDELKNIIEQLRVDNKEMWRKMGEKVDDDELTNAMMTVQKTFSQTEERTRFYIKSALTIATIIIMITVPLGMWIITLLQK